MNQDLPLIPDNLPVHFSVEAIKLMRTDPRFAKRLEAIGLHALRIISAKETLFRRVPWLDEIQNKDETVEVIKPAVSDMDVTEFQAVYTTWSGNKYCVRWVSRDFPSFGIAKGWSVYSHNKPEKYDYLDTSSLDKWTQVHPDDQMYEIAVANVLLGSLYEFCETEDMSRFEQLLDDAFPPKTTDQN